MNLMAADNVNRSADRAVGVMWRMTPEEREEVKQLAQEAGCNVQTYLFRVVLGRTDVQDLPAGRPIRRQEELPMTG